MTELQWIGLAVVGVGVLLACVVAFSFIAFMAAREVQSFGEPIEETKNQETQGE